MTDKEMILDRLHTYKTEWARKYTVRRIGLFGSCVRGQSQSGSDIDVVVDMESPSFDRYMDLKFELEDMLGREVDLVLWDSIKPRLRPIIENEVVYA